MEQVGEVLVHAVTARLPEEGRLNVRLELEPGFGHGVLVRGRPLPRGQLVPRPRHPRVRDGPDQMMVTSWAQALLNTVATNE